MYGHMQCATTTLTKDSQLFVNLVLNGIILTVLVLQVNQSQRTGSVGNVAATVNLFLCYINILFLSSVQHSCSGS